MGYHHEGKVFRLRFAEGEYVGLEVEMVSLPVGKLMRLVALAEQASTKDFGILAELFSAMAGGLKRWNLEDDDGQPVPATLAGIEDQDLDLILTIIATWLEGMGGVSAPLGPSSNSGSSLDLGSVPMEPLTGSLAS